MAWTEPGNQSDGNDPWSGRRKPTKTNDLEKILRDIQQRASQFFSKPDKSGPEMTTPRTLSLP